MPSLKLSQAGLKIVKQARQEKGWTIDNPLWLESASQVLVPESDWEHAEVFARGVSLPTLKRFLHGKGIDSSVFKAFCQVLGLNWQDLIERSLKFSSATIPDIPLFFGRRYELATLTQEIAQGKRLVAITGMGGIGKTARCFKFVCPTNPKLIIFHTCCTF